MTPLVQPTLNSCGQTCVAMLAGVTVEEAMFAVGTSGPTTLADLKRGLRFFGLRIRAASPRSGRSAGIIWLGHPERRWGHWAVRTRAGLFVDPSEGLVESRAAFMKAWATRGWRVRPVLLVSSRAD